MQNQYMEDFAHNKRSLYCKYCACGPKFAGHWKGMVINMSTPVILALIASFLASTSIMHRKNKRMEDCI